MITIPIWLFVLLIVMSVLFLGIVIIAIAHLIKFNRAWGELWNTRNMSQFQNRLVRSSKYGLWGITLPKVISQDYVA